MFCAFVLNTYQISIKYEFESVPISSMSNLFNVMDTLKLSNFEDTTYYEDAYLVLLSMLRSIKVPYVWNNISHTITFGNKSGQYKNISMSDIINCTFEDF